MTAHTAHQFLSIQAQDFIEEGVSSSGPTSQPAAFLSIQAQDFIEEKFDGADVTFELEFLSIQAQDFIEETTSRTIWPASTAIPEHSSSGLH